MQAGNNLSSSLSSGQRRFLASLAAAPAPERRVAQTGAARSADRLHTQGLVPAHEAGHGFGGLLQARDPALLRRRPSRRDRVGRPRASLPLQARPPPERVTRISLVRRVGSCHVVDHRSGRKPGNQDGGASAEHAPVDRFGAFSAAVLAAPSPWRCSANPWRGSKPESLGLRRNHIANGVLWSRNSRGEFRRWPRQGRAFGSLDVAWARARAPQNNMCSGNSRHAHSRRIGGRKARVVRRTAGAAALRQCRPAY